MRTEKQIAAEISLLESYVPRVRTGTFSDNKVSLRAQIRVLKEKMDNDDIYDAWPDDERDTDTRCNALEAMEWMNGDKDEKPSVGWKGLV